MSNINKYINFYNNTDLPIMIDSWIDGSNVLKCLRVGPREKLVIHSSVGEWHLNAMFESADDRKMWKDKGLDECINIGKFRSNPCASGNYSWLDYEDIFECKYYEAWNLGSPYFLMEFILK